MSRVVTTTCVGGITSIVATRSPESQIRNDYTETTTCTNSRKLNAMYINIHNVHEHMDNVMYIPVHAGYKPGPEEVKFLLLHYHTVFKSKFHFVSYWEFQESGSFKVCSNLEVATACEGNEMCLHIAFTCSRNREMLCVLLLTEHRRAK